MSRRMSCSMTIDAVRDRTKTVTRRHPDTWRTLKPGDRLTLIEKGMGLAKGEKQVVLAEVEVVAVRVEPLHLIDDADIRREGLAGMSRWEFCRMWLASHGYARLLRGRFGANEWIETWESIECRRIEWRYLDQPTGDIP